MLGSLDNKVQAGINFRANLDAVDRTKRRLNSLRRDIEQTAGAFIPLSEGSDSTSRSLNRLTGSSAGASGGLAALQSQIVATRAAEESLENQTGDLRSSIRELANDAEDWSVGDTLNVKQQKLIESAALELDDIKFNEQLGIRGEDGLVIQDLDDYEKVVEQITGIGEGFSDGDRKPFLPDIGPTREFRQELEKIDQRTDDVSKHSIWENLFRPIGVDSIETPADTTDEMFPQQTDFGKHLYSDLFKGQDYNTVEQLLGDVRSGDAHLEEMLSVGPSMVEDDVNIFDLFDGGAVPQDREGGDRRLFATLPDEIQDDLLTSLRDADLTSLDDIFSASDVDLNNALIGALTDQDYSLDAESLREEVLEDLADAYPVPKSGQFYDDLKKDLDGIHPPLGELDNARKIDKQRDILQKRRDGFTGTADDLPADFLRAAEDPAVAEGLEAQGLESVGDVADAEISTLNRLPGFGPERSENLKSHAHGLRDSFNAMDENIADGLIDLMGENEEIMSSVLSASSFQDGVRAFSELDEDGLARLTEVLDEKGERILDSTAKASDAIDTADVTSELDRIRSQTHPKEQQELVNKLFRDTSNPEQALPRRQKRMRPLSGLSSTRQLKGVGGNVEKELADSGITSVADVARSDIDALSNIKFIGREKASELQAQAQIIQKQLDGLDANLVDPLVNFMTQNEEVMNTLADSSSIDDAINKLQRREQSFFQGSDDPLQGILEPQNVLRQIDPSDTRSDIHKDLRRTEGIKDSLSDRQIEMMTKIMDDLGGGADDVYGPQPLTRESMGFRTMQELMDTDPEQEPDRTKSLKGILRSIFDPETGIQSTVFDDEQLMKEGFYTDLRDALPDDVVTDGPFDQTGGRPDAAKRITQQFMDTDPDVGLADFFGEDSKSIGEIVGKIDHFEFDHPDVLDEVTSETERMLPKLADLQASRVASSVQSTSRRSDDISGVHELLPGRDFLNFKPDQDIGISPTQQIKNQFESYGENLDKDLADLRGVQKSSPVLQGGALSGITSAFFGERERRRGLFGSLSGRKSTGTNSPVDFRKHQDNLDTLIDSYDGMLPLLDATSIRLGSVNVNFESMGIMLFKLTAMIGPVVAGLMGLATAAVAATAALGGLVAVGAVEYLGEMEDTMAGINNKQEAMAELGDVLTDMAWEAVMPLRQARIGGDGMRGYEAFISALRGGLQVLNRVANIMAYIVELEVVGDELERITEFLLNPAGDQQLAENLGEVVTEVLPLINDALIAIMGNFGNMTDFVASLTANLGDRLLKVFSDLGPVLALITAYGAGFFDAALWGVGVLATLINYVSGVVGVITTLKNALLGTSTETRTLMYWLGAFIGVMNVASRVGAQLAAMKAVLSLAAGGLSKAYGILTASTWSLATATKALAINLTIIAGLILTLTYALNGLANIEIGEDGWLSSLAYYLTVAVASIGGLLAMFVNLGKILAWFGAKMSSVINLIRSSLVFKAIKTVVGMLIYLIKAKLVKAIGVAVGAVLGISAGWAVVITALLVIIPLVADLIYYLRTGDSFLVNWEKRLKQMAEYAERIRDALPGKDSRAVAGPGGNNVDDLAARGARFEPDSGGSNSSEPEVQTAGIDAGPSVQDMADSFSAMINVDASRSERELSKMIRREIDSAFNNYMKRNL